MYRWLIVFLTVTTLTLTACEAVDHNDEATAPPPISTGNSGTDGSANSHCAVTPPEQPLACTQQYDPVCGCDGKTYGNACMARGAGVTDFESGACDAQPD